MKLKHFSSDKIKLDVVESTNTYLIELNTKIKQSNGTIVTTENQIRGRGQKGSVWEADKSDNLTFSIVVYPNINPKYAFYLNIITSLSVQKALNDLGVMAKIKWPNDILVNEKKICGILIENQVLGSKITQSIIGIGLNVLQKEFNNNFKASSVINEGVTVEKEDVLEQVYGYLDFYYNLLIESNYKLLLKHYYKHMFWFEQKGKFEDLDGPFNAMLMGVTEMGMLSLRKENNSVVSYDIKEIKFVY